MENLSSCEKILEKFRLERDLTLSCPYFRKQLGTTTFLLYKIGSSVPIHNSYSFALHSTGHDITNSEWDQLPVGLQLIAQLVVMGDIHISIRRFGIQFSFFLMPSDYSYLTSAEKSNPVTKEQPKRIAQIAQLY